ncbi:MAG: penicillin acylase family protein, partial [Wohlfahrtiimonas sp.]
DLFLEQTRTTKNGLEYLYQGTWQRAKATETVFKVKGQADVTETLYETRRGILLNESLKNRSYLLQPLAVESRYGIALSHYSPANNDNSINALMDLPKQKSVSKAVKLAKEIKVISVNMLFADHKQIGWQLTGSYPIRKKGTGLFPSPAWNGEYDWIGTVPTKLYPSEIQSQKSWLASANNRIVDKNYSANFSQTWAHPERIERITELLDSNKQHNFDSMKQMQYDQYDPMVKKLQHYLASTELSKAIHQLPEPTQQQALLVQERLLAFDGNLTAKSSGAALYSLFLAAFNEQLFADAFTHSPEAWEAFVESSKSYSAQADHLLWQDDKSANASPFWQKPDPKLSGKANIVANALAKAQQTGEKQLGKSYNNWQWGKIHRYKWNSLFSQVAEYLPDDQRKQIDKLDSYLNRGPYPAGGNINTINIASYNIGKGFDTLLIPSMRLIVDFSQQDPVWVMNNAGQSANPASPHYADNINNWLKGDYENLPFSKAKQAKVYRNLMIQFIPKS